MREREREDRETERKIERQKESKILYYAKLMNNSQCTWHDHLSAMFLEHENQPIFATGARKNFTMKCM